MTYTVTEARERLGDLLDQAEKGPVQITRRGKETGVLITLAEYRRLKPDSFDAIMRWREEHADELAEMTDEDLIKAPKRTAPKKKANPWL